MWRYCLVFTAVVIFVAATAVGQEVNTMISIDSASYPETRHLITQLGGRVDFYIAPNSIVAYLPPGTKDLVGRAGIVEVLSSQQVLQNISNEESIALCRDLFLPITDKLDNALPVHREMSKDLMPQSQNCNDHYEMVQINRSIFLIGDQVIRVLTVEGSGDPIYNWKPGEKEIVKGQFLKGLEWIQEFARDSFSVAITWKVEFLPDVTITNEPALCVPGGDQGCAWLTEAIQAANKGSIQAAQEEGIRNFAAQGACVVFLFSDADDYNGQDTLPPLKGYSHFTESWAATMCREHKECEVCPITTYNYGGGYCAISKSASAWGTANLWKIAAHEIYHCYGALDEYDVSDCTTNELGGYLHEPNSNCRGPYQCAMRHAIYEYDHLCSHTAAMLGWQGAGPAINQLPRCMFQPTFRYMPFGNLDLGDYVSAYTLDGDWVTDGLRITRLNSFPDQNHPSKYCLKHDARNFYANQMAPGLYYYFINGLGDPVQTAVIDIPNDELNILWSNFSVADSHIFKIGSGNMAAFTRLEITGGPRNIKIRPIWDEVSETGEIDFAFVADGDYNAKLFGWMPSGSTSPVYNYPFTISRGTPQAPTITSSSVTRQFPANLLVLHIADSNYYIDGIKVEKKTGSNWDSALVISGAGQANIPESTGSRTDTIRAISFNDNGLSVPTITTIKNAPNPPRSLAAAVYMRPRNLGKIVPGYGLHKDTPPPPPPELVRTNQIDVAWQPPLNQCSSISFYRIKYAWFQSCPNPPWCDTYPIHYTPPICSLKYSLYPLPYYNTVYFDVYAFDQTGDSSAFLSGSLTTGTYDAHPQPDTMPDDPLDRVAPKTFSISQNYPNPFNPVTNIDYNLPTNCHVKLMVYNILGQRVKILVDEEQTAGYKTVVWDGKNDQGKTVGSGIYFYRIQAGSFTKTSKMSLLK